MRRLTYLAAMALLCALAGCQPAPNSVADPALVDDVTANARALYAHYDANHDGRLDRTEARALALEGADFDAIDLDHDGTLAWTEFGAPDRLATLSSSFVDIGRALVKAEDDDRDGRLSLAEYRLGMLVPWPGPTVTTPLADPLVVSFSAADRNGDGFLSSDEAPALVGYLLRTGYHLQQRAG